MAQQRNLVIVSTTLVFGIGGMAVGSGDLNLQGVSLCGLVAIVLNLVLPLPKDDVNDLSAEQAVVDDLVDHGRG